MIKKKFIKRCSCGASFITNDDIVEFCDPCLAGLEHDVNVEMFGEDAEYLEHAGLADKIGSK